MTANNHTKLGVKWAVFAVGCGLILRLATGLHSYSGQGKFPMFGDFEAQRHWMEITVNSPVLEWYEHTSFNDLQYWGLDYPPLTAYHSWIMGTVANHVNKTYVEPFKSRGLESHELKFFMRQTVLFADLVLLPALIYYFYTVLKESSRLLKTSVNYLLLATINPSLILIDHGHFQYNNISLGLTVAAVAFLNNDHILLSAVAFSLSLNYKQMSLFHAIPFFVFMLTKCIYHKTFLDGFKQLIKISFVVLLTFFTIWYPFLSNTSTAIQVLRRVFPVDRGIFEDKVGNIWCVINILYKIKIQLTPEATVSIAALLTFLSQVPAIISLFKQPTHKQFLLSLVTGSLGFFLFSYQVHEKSILLVVVPVMLYTHFDPFPSCWFLVVSYISLLHLAIKDNILIVFVTLLIAYLSYLLVNEELFEEERKDFTAMLKLMPSAFGALILLFGFLLVPPPPQYPDLWPLLTAVYSCVHFVGFYLYFIFYQLQAAWST